MTKIDFNTLNVNQCSLVFSEKNRTIIEFPEGLQGKAIVHSNILSDIFSSLGIAIPLEDRVHYDGRSYVYLHDLSLFGKAFYEIYFKSNYDPAKFIWKVNLGG